MPYCIRCKSWIEESGRRYCDACIETLTRYTRPAPPKRYIQHDWSPLLFWILAATLAVGLVFWMYSREKQVFESPLGDAPGPAPESISTGEVLVLYSHETSVFLTTNLLDMERLTSASRQRNVNVVLYLASKGRAFAVPRGTPARVLDRVDHGLLVEILDGPEKGRRGWVPIFWVRRPTQQS